MSDERFSASDDKKQSEMEPVYRLDKDLGSVLHQICTDLRNKENSEIRKEWGVSYHEMSWCSIKTGGDMLELRVERLDGSFREPALNVDELRKKNKETAELLKKFEKAVRKEFKSRTGKALSFVGKKVEKSDYERVALNGVYRFIACKKGHVKTTLDGQSFSDDD